MIFPPHIFICRDNNGHAHFISDALKIVYEFRKNKQTKYFVNIIHKMWNELNPYNCTREREKSRSTEKKLYDFN